MSRIQRRGVPSRSLAVLPALLLSACEPLPPEVSIDCVRHDHCDADQVCFLSQCVNPGSAAAFLYADIVPPNTSGFLPQAESSPRDLTAGLVQDIDLRQPRPLDGSVTAGGNARSGLLTMSPVENTAVPRLPSAVTVFKTITDATGFAIKLLPGASYTFAITPDLGSGRPPYVWSTPVDVGTATARVDLTYPADASLVRMSGTVISDGITRTPKESVLVEGIGNPTASAPTRSTIATTDADGRYTLVFVPATTTFRVKVRPGTNPLVPTAERDLAIIQPAAGAQPGEFEPFDLDLAAGKEKVTVTVRSDAGAPVANATVTFQGEKVGVGTFTASAATGVNGTVQIDLLHGLYTVVVAPAVSSDYALATEPICVAVAGTEGAVCQNPTIPVAQLRLAHATQPLDVSVGVKVAVRVTLSTGADTPVFEARVTMRLRNARVTREFVDTTGPVGAVELSVDPGTIATPAMYDLFVEPQQQSDLPLPLHSEELEVSDAPLQTHAVILRDAALIYGRVLTPTGTPLADVRIGYYSVDPGSSSAAPLLVGLGQTNQQGEYVIPIPAAESQ